MIQTSTASGVTWNGPVCATCHRGYVGSHTCNPSDLRRLVDDLSRRIADLEAAIPKPVNTFGQTCPCNPALGGSGVCGCVLGAWRVTC